MLNEEKVWIKLGEIRKDFKKWKSVPSDNNNKERNRTHVLTSGK